MWTAKVVVNFFSKVLFIEAQLEHSADLWGGIVVVPVAVVDVVVAVAVVIPVAIPVATPVDIPVDIPADVQGRGGGRIRGEDARQVV